MIIQTRPLSPQEIEAKAIAAGHVPAGTTLTRKDVQDFVDKALKPAPVQNVVVSVPASTLRTKAFKRLEEEGIVKKIGRPPTGAAKKAVTIRLDQDVAKALEAREDWRSEVNSVLRSHLGLI